MTTTGGRLRLQRALLRASPTSSVIRLGRRWFDRTLRSVAGSTARFGVSTSSATAGSTARFERRWFDRTLRSVAGSTARFVVDRCMLLHVVRLNEVVVVVVILAVVVSRRRGLVVVVF